MRISRIFIAAAAAAVTFCVPAKTKKPVPPSYAWEIIQPLGLHAPSTIDTLMLNYSLEAVPSAVSTAYATTGNISAPGQNMIFMQRPAHSDFHFRDPLRHWLPSLETQRWYNTRIPMTLLSYNFGGGRDNGQDRLKATFSGNASPEWQVGAMLDYLYSKGSYAYQAAKDLTWGASASYMGSRYEMQAMMYHYNNLCMDNGGITDPLYITDPAELQGGKTSIDAKSIPTRLEAARTRVKGTQVWVNNRYKVGYWHEEQIDDTTTARTYIPVTSFIYTLDYREGKHRFSNSNVLQDRQFWKNTYLSATGTDDQNRYWELRNTLGVALLEGFSKWAKFGLSAYATYEHRVFTQTPYDLDSIPEGLNRFPYVNPIAHARKQNNLYAGAQLTKQQGSILTYEAMGQIGVAGATAGDIEARGSVSTHIPLLGDTVSVTGIASFTNKEAPYFFKEYVSNHFIWDKNFGKERRVRFGGQLAVPRTGTIIEAATETLQNYIYFNHDCLPVQKSDGVQVVSATLRQNFHLGPIHWDNAVTWQTTTDQAVTPMPQLAVYSNLYALFRVARVLHVQLGVDCDYYTKYKGVSYQPATMVFYNQQETEVGNYPFMNLYINMKLSRARFYLMMSHINQGMTGKNYFSMPLYPLNPRRFLLGVSVDFAN